MSRNPYLCQHFGAVEVLRSPRGMISYDEEEIYMDASTGFSRFPNSAHMKSTVFKPSKPTAEPPQKSPLRTPPENIFQMHFRSNKLPFDDFPSNASTPASLGLPPLTPRSQADAASHRSEERSAGPSAPRHTSSSISPAVEANGHAPPRRFADSATSQQDPPCFTPPVEPQEVIAPRPEAPTAAVSEGDSTAHLDTLLERSRVALAHAQSLLDEPVTVGDTSHLSTALTDNSKASADLEPPPPLPPPPLVEEVRGADGHADHDPLHDDDSHAITVSPVTDCCALSDTKKFDHVGALLDGSEGTTSSFTEETTRRICVTLCPHPEWQAARRMLRRRPPPQPQSVVEVMAAPAERAQGQLDTQLQRSHRPSEDAVLSVSAFNSLLSQLGQFLQAGNPRSFGPRSPTAEAFGAMQQPAGGRPREKPATQIRPGPPVPPQRDENGAENVLLPRAVQFSHQRTVPPPQVLTGRQPPKLRMMRASRRNSAAHSSSGAGNKSPSYAQPTHSWSQKKGGGADYVAALGVESPEGEGNTAQLY